MKKVYYAGKIDKMDWRHSFYTKLRGFNFDGTSQFWSKEVLQINGIEYSGPYFMSCDHGCYHGDGTHGVGAGEGTASMCDVDRIKAEVVIDKCYEFIRSSDIVFCYIDSSDCFGIITEIGYAKSIGKKLFIVVNDSKLKKNELKDMWFPLNNADKLIFSSDIFEAHKEFENWIEKI